MFAYFGCASGIHILSLDIYKSIESFNVMFAALQVATYFLSVKKGTLMDFAIKHFITVRFIKCAPLTRTCLYTSSFHNRLCTNIFQLMSSCCSYVDPHGSDSCASLLVLNQILVICCVTNNVNALKVSKILIFLLWPS